MLQFINWSSGSNGNAYYLFTRSEGILIDAGIGIRKIKKYFKDYNLPLSMLKYILVTHDHADHVKSVGKLSQELQIPVYATIEVHYGIRSNFCVRHKIPADQIRFITKNMPFTLGPWKITAFEVPHDSRDNVGYHLQYKDVDFCLITDAGSVTDTMKQHIREATHLVLEANHDVDMVTYGAYPQRLKRRILGDFGHLSNQDCAQVLSENLSQRMQNIWLCHLSAENNRPEIALETVNNAIRSILKSLNHDVELSVLERAKPSKLYLLSSEKQLNLFGE